MISNILGFSTNQTHKWFILVHALDMNTSYMYIGNIIKQILKRWLKILFCQQINSIYYYYFHFDIYITILYLNCWNFNIQIYFIWCASNIINIYRENGSRYGINGITWKRIIKYVCKSWKRCNRKINSIIQFEYNQKKIKKNMKICCTIIEVLITLTTLSMPRFSYK